MVAVLVISIIVVAALGAVAIWLARTVRALQAGTQQTVVERTSDVDRRLGSLQESFDRRLADMDDKVGKRLEGIDGRLLATQRSTGETTTQIVEKLGRLDTSAAQMLARANDLSRLETALRPPKARGGVGELMLGNLLRDCLPADAYQLQFGFGGGERVDAVIKVQRLLPVDAKFPLDNFLRVTDAASDEEQLAAERAFARDVKGHVDAIASKYIRPAEGTFDFAFMYLPSEAVYYELVCGTTGDLYGYALGKRVYPVSPSTFHAYLQMILLGLKGLQIEQHAHEVMSYCAQLAKEFEKFETDFDVVGKHLTNAQSKWAEAGGKLDRLGASLDQATRWELEQGAREAVVADALVLDEDDDAPGPFAVQAA